MRILLTNNTLDERAGTELYTRDVALALRRRGHEVAAFSTILGTVADELRSSGIEVADDPAMLGGAPDVIHGHHHYDTLIAALSFPRSPVISFCHGSEPVEEAPLVFPGVVSYVAVDEPSYQRVIRAGIDPDRVKLVRNFVDLSRFRPRGPLPERPARALAFGNPYRNDADAAALRSACESAGIALDIAGAESGYVISQPEDVLPVYDLVFAKARAALEAMAVGCSVVLCGPKGLGPMVQPDNWDELRPLNFGWTTLRAPITAERVAAEIAKYDAGAAGEVSATTRREAGMEAAVDQLVALYEDAIREFANGGAPVSDSRGAMAEYLLGHSLTYKSRAERCAPHVEGGRGMSSIWRMRYEAMRDSATWRISRAALESGPGRVLAVWLEPLARRLRKR